jgi:hypothetical protein
MRDVTVDDLPVVELMPHGREPAAASVYDRRGPLHRRDVLRLGMRVGVVIGLAMLGVFKSVRRAAADFPYREHSSCGRYDPDVWNGFDGHNDGFFEPGTCNDDACIGVPDDAMGLWYCVSCAEVSAHNPYGWHFVGRRGPFVYGDATDVCSPDAVGVDPRDAWTWQIPTCESCTPALFRCHDGWKLDPAGEVTSTVCQGLVECNGSPYQPC